MTKEDKLQMLRTHRDRLAGARTLEEYRTAHVQYVEELILQIEKEEERWLAVLEAAKAGNENGSS